MMETFRMRTRRYLPEISGTNPGHVDDALDSRIDRIHEICARFRRTFSIPIASFADIP